MPEWVEQNLNLILSDENWDTVWGTYLHWSRPSRDLFNLFMKKGVYNKAIERKDRIQRDKSNEKATEELANHFVIAYFNGWLDSYEDAVFQKFLSAASDELLGYTANFFTTGFKSQKEDPKDGVNDRLKTYWEKRLEVITERPDDHCSEASALAYWIKDCPLDGNGALDLEERTLNLCNGKLSNDYNAGKSIKVLCSLIDDKNLVQVIRCIRKIVNNPPEYMYWKDSHDSFNNIFDSVIKNEAAPVDLIQEAMGLADDLGRQRDYQYKGVFEQLFERLDVR